jgi:hypothetical protein
MYMDCMQISIQAVAILSLISGNASEKNWNKMKA